MTPEEAKAGIATILCLQFVNLRQSTRRRDLIVKFKNPQLLSEMEQQGLCRAQDNQKVYLPTVGSFALISDIQVSAMARLGTVRTIHILRNLFEVYEREEPYTFDELEAHAKIIYDDVLSADVMRLGLYLSVDLGAIGSYGHTDDEIDIRSFTIPEHILTFENPEEIWDRRIESAKNQAKGINVAPFSLASDEPSDQTTTGYQIKGTQSWYFQESSRMSQKTLRCPFAAPDLCPRYFQSLTLSGELGATEMASSDESRLRAKWDNAAPFAVLREQLPSVQRGDGEFSSLVNFCPEVAYDIQGVFASMLGRYVDEIDRDLAHQRLSRLDVSIDDPAWSWGFVVPLHYTSCPTFSVLAGRASSLQDAQHELLEAMLSLPEVDAKYVTAQIDRMSTKDPALAIGTAKEVLETCCKTILKTFGKTEQSPKVTGLVKATVQALQDANCIPKASSDSAKTIVNALGTLVAGIAELRNSHGTGHGKAEGSVEIGVTQARLAIGATTTLCVYFAGCIHGTNLATSASGESSQT